MDGERTMSLGIGGGGLVSGEFRTVSSFTVLSLSLVLVLFGTTRSGPLSACTGVVALLDSDSDFVAAG